jgi:uncharacterized protein
MSDSPLPGYVDARKIFTQQGTVSGNLRLHRLKRCSASLADQDGEASVWLSFCLDEFGRRRIKGELSARVKVLCQRCLEPLAIQLRDVIDLVLVEDEESALALDKQYEVWVAVDHKIDLLNLIDEQMMLCMPIVSIHESGPCAESAGFSTESPAEATEHEKCTKQRINNPFSKLAELKKP